jgi:N-acetyl-gamma-glutamylphosphate reductase
VELLRSLLADKIVETTSEGQVIAGKGTSGAGKPLDEHERFTDTRVS